MNTNELQKFIQKIKNNASLKAALSSAPDAETVAAIGRKAGFELSAEDLTRYPKNLNSLGADELELVAGGLRASGSTHINNWSTWICGCKAK